jgi:hypothetical protein
MPMLELDSPSAERLDLSAIASNRRAHTRVPAQQLEWLRSIRVKVGQTISPIALIDLSPGGALYESRSPMKPGTAATLTIVGREVVETTGVRVLRCEVSRLDGGLIYRGACEFDRKIALPGAPPKELVSLADSGGAAAMATLNAGLRRGDPPEALMAMLERHEPSAATSAPTPDHVTTWHRLVVRYLDGRLLKGFTQDFHPSRVSFHLWPALGPGAAEPILVPVSQLKAVFFVRDFDGNPRRVERNTFVGAHSGRRIEITFLDDEVMRGSTLSYRPDRAGFFITPADTSGNNLRVFVISAAVRHIRYVS